MDKKIIAVALVLVLMVTAFVGCGQKYKTTKVGDGEYLLETDREGNTIIREEGIVAIVTDREGEIITYENGENQTYYVPVPGSLVIDGVVRGEHFKLNILDGWTSTDFDRINKDGTDNKCFIDFSDVCVLEEDEKFEDVFVESDKMNEEIRDTFNDQEKMKEVVKENPNLADYLGGKCTFETTKTTFTSDGYPCRVSIMKIVDAESNVIHYSEAYYFLVEKNVYSVGYTCLDGVGYDENFDFDTYIRQNFTFVK